MGKLKIDQMGCACVKPVKSMNHNQMPLFRIGERKEG